MIAPAPVLDAVKLMWGGAADTALQLIIALFYLGDIKAYHLTVLGHTSPPPSSSTSARSSSRWR